MDKMIFLGATYGTFEKDGEKIKFARIFLGEIRESDKHITRTGYVVGSFKLADPQLVYGLEALDEVEVTFNRFGVVSGLKKC